MTITDKDAIVPIVLGLGLSPRGLDDIYPSEREFKSSFKLIGTHENAKPIKKRKVNRKRGW